MIQASALSIAPESPVEHATALWSPIDESICELKQLIGIADRAAIERGSVPIALADRIAQRFETFVAVFDATVRRADHCAATIVGARARAELLAYMLLSENAERWYSKPRGYAGDFLTIAQIYDDVPRGTGRIGPLLDRCFLEVPAARAVKNRRRLLACELVATVEACAGRRARITSLASGPARELFDAYLELDDRGALASTLVDLDPLALTYCADRRTIHQLDDQIALVNANVIHLATGRRQIELADQDLVYSVGLIDYLSDELVVKLLDYVHRILRPGGRVILGNFHPRNPTKALMDHVLDWKLIHRTEDDMHALFRASTFGTRCSRILYESQRINLFAECIKS